MDAFSIIKRRLKLIFIVDKLSFCQYPYQILFQWPVFKGSVAALQIFKGPLDDNFKLGNSIWEIWIMVFKNGLSKICRRQSLKKLKWYGLLRQTISLQIF